MAACEREQVEAHGASLLLSQRHELGRRIVAGSVASSSVEQVSRCALYRRPRRRQVVLVRRHAAGIGTPPTSVASRARVSVKQHQTWRH